MQSFQIDPKRSYNGPPVGFARVNFPSAIIRPANQNWAWQPENRREKLTVKDNRGRFIKIS